MSKEQIEEENNYNLFLALQNELDAGLVVSPIWTREYVEGLLTDYPCIKALKPYLTHSRSNQLFESDILDFAPEWIWALANDREMAVMLHLSHYNDMLNDERNWQQIRYVSQKYPNCKIILAHCAMGHHVRKLRLGLEHIKDLKNIWFDCSGADETMSIYYCLKAFGVERMMYGGDFCHSASVGRICSFGSNFIGFHEYCVKKEGIPGCYQYHPLNNGQECLLALLEACELLALEKEDIEKIFYGNAIGVFNRK